MGTEGQTGEHTNVHVSSDSMSSIVVMGHGGLAREMSQLVRLLFGRQAFGGYVVERRDTLTGCDTPDIAGDDDWLLLQGRSGQPLTVVVGSGFPSIRSRMSSIIHDAGLTSPVLIHPTAVLDHHDVEIGSGVVICAGCVLTIDVSIGPYSLVNWNSTIGHDTSIGSNCVINPGANIAGNVHLGERVLIGAGAQVLQGRTVGDDAVVGAGAVVTRDVAPGAVVMGVPARALAR